MELNGLGSMTTDKLLSLAMSNSSSDSKSSTDDLQFAAIMQTLMGNSNQSSSKSDGLNELKSVENTQTTPGQRLDYMKMVLNENLKPIETTYNNTSIASLSAQTSDEKMKQIYAAVENSSQKYGVDSNLILGIIKQESDFNPSATSSAGAMGLMQLMPENCVEDGVNDAFDIEQNIEGGVKQLKNYMNQYNGSVEMALMAYNAGPGTMQRRGVTSTDDLYKMPKETQNYIPKVMSYYQNGI